MNSERANTPVTTLAPWSKAMRAEMWLAPKVTAITIRMTMPGRGGMYDAISASPRFSMKRDDPVSRPWPVFRLVNTNGRSPRIFFASRSITSSEAPTIGARSILLMTSRSLLVMPGPPLRGILSPAATSIT